MVLGGRIAESIIFNSVTSGMLVSFGTVIQLSSALTMYVTHQEGHPDCKNFYSSIPKCSFGKPF